MKRTTTSFKPLLTSSSAVRGRKHLLALDRNGTVLRKDPLFRALLLAEPGQTWNAQPVVNDAIRQGVASLLRNPGQAHFEVWSMASSMNQQPWILQSEWINESTAQISAREGTLRPTSDATAKASSAERMRRDDFMDLILNEVKELIYIYDLDQQRNVYANRELSEMLQYSTEEFRALPKGVQDIIHPEDQARVLAHQRRLRTLEDGQIAEVIYRVQDSNGKWITLSSIDRAFERNDSSEVALILGVARDISEHIRLTEKLALREAHYRRLWEQAPDVLSIMNHRYEVLDLNRSPAARVSVDQLVGTGWTRFIEPSEIQQIKDAVDTCLEENRTVKLEMRTSLGGIVQHYVHTVAPFENEGPGQVLINSTNLSDLRTTQATLRAIVDSIPDQVMLATPDFQVIDCLHLPHNQYCCEQSIHEHYGAMLPTRTIQRKLVTQDLHIEKVRQGKDWFEFRFIANRNANQVLLMIRNVTEAMSLQESLERKSMELANTNRELEQFAYIASHDLQEPLRTAINFMNLVRLDRDSTWSEKAQCYMEKGEQACRRMHGLIRSLLEFSRLSASEIKREKVALRPLLEDIQQMFSDELAKVDGHLEVEDLPDIYADRTMLTQAFINLTSNAIKFRSDHAVRIRVSCEQDAGGIVIRFTDNGRGIRTADGERIFQMFRQVEAADQDQGHGIGLTFVKRIFDKHGATICVDPSHTEGTQFLIRWPLLS